MPITTGRMEFLSRLLDVASLRHDVIAQNIANVNTPGFQTLEVSFENLLTEAISGDTGARPEAKVMTASGGAERADGNNVDVDLELARLQKNSLYFKIYTQLLATELAQFRSAISGR